jgi:hypothetical protein
MIRIIALFISAALTLASIEADAACLRGAAGCGVGFHGAGAGAGARGVGVVPGNHHAGNRNGGVNRVGRRR